MPADGLLAELEALALAALIKAGAVRRCAVHPQIIVRLGDERAESRAFSVAMIDLWDRDRLHLQEALAVSIDAALADAADGTCPLCG